MRLRIGHGSGLLRVSRGGVNTKQAERAAEALGAGIAVDEREKTSPTAPTLYLGMDGTGAPMRSPEVARRTGKKADGSAKTCEVARLTVWTAEGRDQEGTPERHPGSITSSAAIQTAATLDTCPELSDFTARVLRESRASEARTMEATMEAGSEPAGEIEDGA